MAEGDAPAVTTSRFETTEAGGRDRSADAVEIDRASPKNTEG